MSPRLAALHLALLAAIHAAPAINKVEPPNWWVHHTLKSIQLLLLNRAGDLPFELDLTALGISDGGKFTGEHADLMVTHGRIAIPHPPPIGIYHQPR